MNFYYFCINEESNSQTYFTRVLGKAPRLRGVFENLDQVVSQANWFSPNDVKQNYANTSILKNQRVVFNIKGNDYRLIAKVNYKAQMLFIRFIGTHAEYDQIDAETV